MTCRRIPLLSYVYGQPVRERCACDACSPAWRREVLRAVLPDHGVTAYVAGDMLDLAKTLEAP